MDAYLKSFPGWLIPRCDWWDSNLQPLTPQSSALTMYVSYILYAKSLWRVLMYMKDHAPVS